MRWNAYMMGMVDGTGLTLPKLRNIMMMYDTLWSMLKTVRHKLTFAKIKSAPFKTRRSGNYHHHPQPRRRVIKNPRGLQGKALADRLKMKRKMVTVSLTFSPDKQI